MPMVPSFISHIIAATTLGRDVIWRLRACAQLVHQQRGQVPHLVEIAKIDHHRHIRQFARLHGSIY